MRKYKVSKIALVAICLSGVSIVISAAQLIQAAMTPNVSHEWLSAWSTFWGAVATGLGAFLTGGALIVAALSYRHQVEERVRVSEQHRQAADDKKEASKRTRRRQARNVSMVRRGQLLELRNGSRQPISNLQLLCLDRNDQILMKQVVYALLPGQVFSLDVRSSALEKAWAQFTDAAGVVWRMNLNGDLEEV